MSEKTLEMHRPRCPDHPNGLSVERLVCSKCRSWLFDCDHVNEPTEYVYTCSVCDREIKMGDDR